MDWQDWRSVLDEPQLRSSNSPKSVLAVGLFLFALWLAERSPAVAAVVPIDSHTLAWSVAPAWALSLGLSIVQRRNAIAGRHDSVWLIFGAAAIVAYEAGCLVCVSGLSAAPVFAGFVALACAAHGHQGRVTIRHPYVAIADAAGLLLSVLWSPSLGHATLIALGAVGGITAGAVLGTAADGSERSRRRADAMREALSAQIAADRSAKAAELHGMVLDARARGHDVRNALTTALIDLGILVDALRARRASELPDAEMILDALNTAVRVSSRHAVAGSPRREPVVLDDLLHAALKGMGSRFSRVRFELDLPEGPPLVVQVEDGVAGLRRMVDNLLLNAAEGNGVEHATRAVLRVRRESDATMTTLEVEDDGPGFGAKQLAEPIQGFATTKPDGTGLGLYTVEHLAKASGGWVERRNGATRGAIVTVVLPTEPDAGEGEDAEGARE